jgi:tRNA G18 (ribose-2'-O)-methylase SpoU
MVKRSREYIYGVNPAFEVVRAGKRRIYEAYINEATSGKPQIQKLSGFLKKQNIQIQWVDKRRVMDLAESKEHQGVILKTSPYLRHSERHGQG